MHGVIAQVTHELECCFAHIHTRCFHCKLTQGGQTWWSSDWRLACTATAACDCSGLSGHSKDICMWGHMHTYIPRTPAPPQIEHPSGRVTLPSDQCIPLLYMCYLKSNSYELYYYIILIIIRNCTVGKWRANLLLVIVPSSHSCSCLPVWTSILYVVGEFCI